MEGFQTADAIEDAGSEILASLCGRCLLFFPAIGGTSGFGTETTKGSISQGETLSGLEMDAGSSH